MCTQLVRCVCAVHNTAHFQQNLCSCQRHLCLTNKGNDDFALKKREKCKLPGYCITWVHDSAIHHLGEGGGGVHTWAFQHYRENAKVQARPKQNVKNHRQKYRVAGLIFDTQVIRPYSSTVCSSQTSNKPNILRVEMSTCYSTSSRVKKN